MRGIDISHHNGWPFNAITSTAYKSSDFVFIKATQGVSYKYTDYFYNAVNKAIKDNKLIGAYHYAAGNDPVQEADYFISIVKRYIGKIILALDWETTQNTAWGDTEWAKKFVDRVKEQTGLSCFLYANMAGLKQCTNLKNSCPLWFAGYPTNKNSWSIPAWPSHYSTKPWTHYTIWQFTSGNEQVDRNISSMTKADWAKWGKIELEDNKVTAQDIINIIYSWRGLSRKDRSHKIIIDLYNSFTPLPRGYKVTYTDNYCAVTVSAAFIKAHAVDLIGGIECSVQRLIDCFKKIGIWNEDGTIVPKPGYIICYNWDDDTQPNDGWADHVGVVVKVENGIITVIEGNYGGEVKERKIKVGHGNIRGYACPHYYVPSTNKEDTTNLTRAQLLQLVADTMQGKYGKGDDRRIKLGTNYIEVQNVINHIARSKISVLAQETLKGDYGNGEIRKAVLGDKYTAVQSAVNKLVK